MANWSAIEASFLRQSHPQQLGELASSLARLKSWSQKNASREIVPVLLEENLLYVEAKQVDLTRVPRFFGAGTPIRYWFPTPQLTKPNLSKVN